MSTVMLSAMAFALFWALPAGAAPESADPGPAPTTADYYRVRDGFIAAREKRCEDAVALLAPAISSQTFPGFPQRVRRGALEHATKCAHRISGWAAALPYLYDLIEIPHKDRAYWTRQIVYAGLSLRDPEISVDGIRRLAVLDPREVSRIDLISLLYVDQYISLQDRGDDLRFSFLRTLHEVRYESTNPFEVADDLMVGYARMAADRGDTDDLRDIVLSLTQLRNILEVRIDRRFDAIRQDGSLEAFLDLEDAAQKEIVRLEVLLEKHDKYALGHLHYAKALAALWKYEEALQAIEPIALKIRTPDGRDDFVDSEYYESWILREYSRALSRLTYREQSEDLFKEAVSPLDSDQKDVSQQINYSSKKLHDGHYAEALEAIADLDDSRASEYGRMWLRRTRVCANVLAQNGTDYSESLKYLIENERANRKALLSAFLCMNDLDRAAEVLIRRLYSTEDRMAALLSMQIQKSRDGSKSSPRSRAQQHSPDDDISTLHLLRHREEALHSRQDVLNAVNAVGRIEEVPLQKAAWWRP